jgi:hypothetical protein
MGDQASAAAAGDGDLRQSVKMAVLAVLMAMLRIKFMPPPTST